MIFTGLTHLDTKRPAAAREPQLTLGLVRHFGPILVRLWSSHRNIYLAHSVTKDGLVNVAALGSSRLRNADTGPIRPQCLRVFSPQTRLEFELGNENDLPIKEAPVVTDDWDIAVTQPDLSGAAARIFEELEKLPEEYRAGVLDDVNHSLNAIALKQTL